VYLIRARALLPACDAVDVMLLLRGLAAGLERFPGEQEAYARADEAEPAGEGRPPEPRPRVAAQSASCAVPQPLLGDELADDALRRYAVGSFQGRGGGSGSTEGRRRWGGVHGRDADRRARVVKKRRRAAKITPVVGLMYELAAGLKEGV
jgi:hypothetical protein